MDTTAETRTYERDAAASSAPARRRRRLTRSLTLAAAAAAALTLWVVTVPVLGMDLRVGTGASALTIGPTSAVVASVVAGAVSWALLALLERFRHGRRVWLALGWAVLVLSLSAPITMGADVGTQASLTAMHIVVGGILIVGLAGAGIRPAGGMSGTP